MLVYRSTVLVHFHIPSLPLLNTHLPFLLFHPSIPLHTFTCVSRLDLFAVPNFSSSFRFPPLPLPHTPTSLFLHPNTPFHTLTCMLRIYLFVVPQFSFIFPTPPFPLTLSHLSPPPPQHSFPLPAIRASHLAGLRTLVAPVPDDPPAGGNGRHPSRKEMGNGQTY